jgi:hypothetical protein
MNTFTEQDMKEYAHYTTKAFALNMESNFKHWCKERFEPTKKVIDLSVLIDSEVLCVFFDPSTPSSATGKLEDIRGSAYVSNNRDSSGRPVISRACKPLMNHKHAWDGGECPIEGFVVRAWVDKQDFLTVLTSSNSIDWSKIMYVEFLETEHDYVMPWEVSDE